MVRSHLGVLHPKFESCPSIVFLAFIINYYKGYTYGLIGNNLTFFLLYGILLSKLSLNKNC